MKTVRDFCMNLTQLTLYVHCESKNQATILLSVTLPNVDRFSKFFQLQTVVNLHLSHY